MGRGETIRSLVATVALLFLIAVPTSGADRFPDPIGYVNDFGDVLTDAEEAAITAYLDAVERRSGIEMAVVTLPTLGDYDVDDAANRIYEQWGIGKKGGDRGILLLDGVAERRIRIEVGYGLEGALPDGKVGSIIHDYAVPLLQQGQRGAAYLATLRVVTGIAFGEVGIDPAAADSLAGGRFLRQRPRTSQTPGAVSVIVIILLIIILRSVFGRGRGGGFYGGFPGGFGGFGGFGGGSGGSGGGFGGFGGGSSGGGGASSGY